MLSDENPRGDSEAAEELRLLYSVSVTDIAFFKQQQWVASNYGVAVQAGVIALVGTGEAKWASWELLALAAASVVSCVGTMVVLARLLASINLRRDRLENVRKSFSDAFRRAWLVRKDDDNLHLILHAAQVLATVAAIWIVMRHLLAPIGASR